MLITFSVVDLKIGNVNGIPSVESRPWVLSVVVVPTTVVVDTNVAVDDHNFGVADGGCVDSVGATDCGGDAGVD